MNRRAESIDRVFARLSELGCDPKLAADGRTIVATCPCCREPDALEVKFPTPVQEHEQ